MKDGEIEEQTTVEVGNTFFAWRPVTIKQEGACWFKRIRWLTNVVEMNTTYKKIQWHKAGYSWPVDEYYGSVIDHRNETYLISEEEHLFNVIRSKG